ncbi:MAG: hypothetical protein HDS48_03710 [Bacteroides sp.]|nr:hypothetical protein [Bacteroides sp.]
MKLSGFILSLFLGAFSINFMTGSLRGIPPSLLQDRQLGMAANFLNHYADILTLPSSEEKEDRIRRIKDDGFTYLSGNDEALIAIPDDASFSLNFNKGVYTASWDKNGRVLVSCKFPAKIGLLKQGNKKDLELLIIEKLQANTNSISPIALPTASKDELNRLPFSKFYIKDNGHYITPELASKVIYLPHKDENTNIPLLIDFGTYPTESLANVFLTGYSPAPLPMKVTVKQYGYTSTTVNTSLSELYGIFSEEGCLPFWATKDCSKGMVEGLYLWKNDLGGYCHVVSVKTPLSVFDSEGTIEATLFAYVRLDNLKSLFEEFQGI